MKSVEDCGHAIRRLAQHLYQNWLAKDGESALTAYSEASALEVHYLPQVLKQWASLDDEVRKDIGYGIKEVKTIVQRVIHTTLQLVGVERGDGKRLSHQDIRSEQIVNRINGLQCQQDVDLGFDKEQVNELCELARKFGVTSGLPLSPSLPSQPPSPCRLSVHLDTCVVTLDGKPYPVHEDMVRFFSDMLESWKGDRERIAIGRYNSNARRLFNALPDELKDIVDKPRNEKAKLRL